MSFTTTNIYLSAGITWCVLPGSTTTFYLELNNVLPGTQCVLTSTGNSIR